MRGKLGDKVRLQHILDAILHNIPFKTLAKRKMFFRPEHGGFKYSGCNSAQYPF
jgi:hypothetical protein